MNDDPAQINQPTSYVDDYQPPVNNQVSHSTNAYSNRVMSVDPKKSDLGELKVAKQDDAESLKNQNIFFMLGVDDQSEELRDKFLNELQTVIWDDFIENDVRLLITSDEQVEFEELLAQKNRAQEKLEKDRAHDAIVVYLEKLIPDLEDMMLEKALQLKSDLFIERIKGMKEYHADNVEDLNIINEAEKLMLNDKWLSAAQTLNKVTS